MLKFRQSIKGTRRNPGIPFLLAAVLALWTVTNKAWAQPPEFAWVSQAGGPGYFDSHGFEFSGSDPLGFALDGAGDTIFTARFFSMTPTFAGQTGTNNLELGSVIGKCDPAGNLLWSHSLGTNTSYAGVAADASGNVYAFGFTNVAYLTNGYIVGDVKLSKYDGGGNLLWSVTSQGNALDDGSSIALDSATNIYVTGLLSSSNMTLGSVTLTSSETNEAEFEAFIAKFDAKGNALWAKAIPGADVYTTQFTRPAFDASGNVIFIETFNKPIDFGTVVLTNIGTEDLCVAKYDTAGNLIFAKDVATGDFFEPQYETTDPEGNFYFSGSYTGSAAIFGGIAVTNQSYQTTYLAKCDSNANVLWVRQPQALNGSTGLGSGAAFADGAGNIYQGGTYSGHIVNVGGVTLTNTGGYSSYVIKYDRFGNVPWVIQMNPLPSQGFPTVAPGFVEGDSVGDIFVYGQFDSPGAAFGQLSVTTVNQSQLFLARIDGPRLSATAGTGGIVVSWPTNATGLSLVSATDLGSGNWTAVTNVPAVVGNQFVVTNTVSAGSRFFRLRSF